LEAGIAVALKMFTLSHAQPYQLPTEKNEERNEQITLNTKVIKLLYLQ
jgi:hypothetical protein